MIARHRATPRYSLPTSGAYRALRRIRRARIGLSMHAQPRSRLTPTPRGRRLALTPRDLLLFGVLDRYRYMPSNFLLAFLGGHSTYHRQRLTDLFHEGWLRKPASQWETFNARYRPNSYELTPKARSALAGVAGLSSHIIGAGAPFWHEHLVCLVMASIELSARQGGVALLSWRDVLDRAPRGTQQSATPFAIPVQSTEAGHRTLRPDGLPFGLMGSRALWFPGIEVDRHTEPLHPTDLRGRGSSILLKFVLYRQFVRDRVFEAHYGMPNAMVPIVTVNTAHMRNMIDLAMSLSEGRGFKWMLFRSLEDVSSRSSTPEPQLDLLSGTWERPGNAPVRLIEELNRA